MSTSSSGPMPTESTEPSSRPLKRRYTAAPDLSFFVPSATTFRPRPYLPHSSHSVPHRKPSPIRSSNGSIHPLPPADPMPDDPYAVFLHPPFNSFPDSDLYNEDLTYNVMAVNPEWFLDPADFISAGNPNPNAIPYPSALEPPRGWCGTIKKKDVRDKGSEGWPEGDEPRLRCTFCRRTYAGINAKSMWRRHVFEKHKIAMANRRDGPERGRGSRSSNKENKQATQRDKSNQDCRFPPNDEACIATSCPRPLQTHSQTIKPEGDDATHSKLRLRSNLPDGSEPSPDAPISTQKELTQSGPEQYNLSILNTTVLSTPLSSPRIQASAFVPSPSRSISPTRPYHTIPPSPYDPTQTPAFRHSSQRLPCEQPWRFPSPSHPLHSSPEELCLGVAVAGISGEGLESAYIPLVSSPLPPLRSSRSLASLASSPFTLNKSSPLTKMFTGKVLGFEKKRSVSHSEVDLGHKGVPQPEPRRLFYSGPLPVPVSDRVEFPSDLSGASDAEPEPEQKHAAASFTVDSTDPFGGWFDFDDSALTQTEKHQSDCTEYPEAPVLKIVDLPATSGKEAPMSYDQSTQWNCQPSGLGLGILMPKEDFEYRCDSAWTYPHATDLELDEMAREAEEVEGELTYPSSQEEQDASDDSPTDEEFPDYQSYSPMVAPPLKRRRTINGSL